MPDKQAVDVLAPARAYTGFAEAAPWADVLLHGGAGSLAGTAAGTLFWDKIQPFLTRFAMSEQEKADMEREYNTPEGRAEVIRNLSNLGGVLGAGMGAVKHLDTTSGLRGAFKSLTQPNYYQNNPVALQLQKKKALDAVKNLKSTAVPYFSGRTKTAAQDFEQGFHQNTVPIATSVDLIQRDPFLSLGQKEAVSGLFRAEGKDVGMTSGQKLTRAALRAGVGMVTGYTFGKTMGHLMSMPKPARDSLSRAGGVAGAVVNTGIFGELGI